jgi:CopG family transcriptional regulator / antitoxin EndoAI
MNRRINIMLSESTLAVLDRVADKGSRSRFISMAVLHYVRAQSKENLRERLKREALADAQRDLDMAAQWFPLEEEAWQKTLGKRQRK